MSLARKNLQISAPIVPYPNNVNNYPTHYAKYGNGGFQSFLTIEERNALPNSRREEGMTVYVKDQVDNPLFTLKGGISNDNWVPITSLLRNNTFYLVYISEEEPVNLSEPMYLWLNPTNGAMMYKPGFNKNYKEVHFASMDVDGGEF